MWFVGTIVNFVGTMVDFVGTMVDFVEDRWGSWTVKDSLAVVSGPETWVDDAGSYWC